ncbi:MAG: tRNA pseudouridine(38-40) synthase TruA [Actinobacteria bacterium]|nr:tRNA pseudouridine(38-40) synthase TruA [Actinomycetota bacterium]
MVLSNEPLVANAAQGLIRIRGKISYDGKDFSGWGMQPDRRTVQGELENAISTLLRVDRVIVHCAGRTDAGVHASAQVIHFDIAEKDAMEMKDLTYRINAILPEDISIQELEVTAADFDARFAALSRSYEYLIYQGQRNPLLRDRAYRSYLTLDVSAMNEASQVLIGLHDFSAFCKKREGATTIRTLMKFNWTETDDGLIKVELEADAFCYSMVRGLIGAVLAIGEGKFDKTWLEDYLAGKEREAHVFAAPALGLTLVDVKYPAPSEYTKRIAETLQVRDSDTLES